MKHLKRVIIVLYFIILLFVSIKTKAIGYDDTKKASYDANETVASFSTPFTTYQTDYGTSTFNGSESSQHVHIMTQHETNDSKIVTWAVADKNGAFVRTNVAGIAKDYEEKHPEYQVIGGVNGDQFTLGFGKNLWVNGKDPYHLQSYYPFIADNEGWFIITAMPSNGGKFAIMHTDGRTNSLEYDTNNHEISGMFLYILDENNERTHKFRVDHFNETPIMDEISVFCSRYDDDGNYIEKDIYEENLYLIENAELCLPNNSIDYYDYKGEYAQNGFFGKGHITSINNKNTLGFGDFAISTNNESLKEYLKIGAKVLVQYEYLGLEDIESAIGFHTVQKEKGVDNVIPASDAYNNRKYPRSLIGQKENGDFVLIAIDGLQEKIGASGANFEEINAILDYYGVVTCYQMDGGGSVTMVTKNDNGGFKVVNSPSDSSARSVLNAVLFVEKRRPTGEISINSMNEDNVSFNIDIEKNNNIINNMKLVIDNKEYDINSDTITINNLARNNTLEYKLVFNITNGNNEEEIVTINKEIFIPLLTPSLDYCIKEEIEDGISLKININDFDDNIRRKYLLINGISYDILSENIIINDYSIDYYIYLKIEYFDGKSVKVLTIIHPESIPLNRLYGYLGSINDDIYNLKVFK